MSVPVDQAYHPRIRVMLSQFAQWLVLAENSEQTWSWNQYVHYASRPA